MENRYGHIYLNIAAHEFIRQSFTKDTAACLTLKVSMPTGKQAKVGKRGVRCVSVERAIEPKMWDSDLRKWTRVFLYKCKVFRRGRPVNKLIGSTFTLRETVSQCQSVNSTTILGYKCVVLQEEQQARSVTAY